MAKKKRARLKAGPRRGVKKKSHAQEAWITQLCRCFPMELPVTADDAALLKNHIVDIDVCGLVIHVSHFLSSYCPLLLYQKVDRLQW